LTESKRGTIESEKGALAEKPPKRGTERVDTLRGADINNNLHNHGE